MSDIGAGYFGADRDAGCDAETGSEHRRHHRSAADTCSTDQQAGKNIRKFHNPFVGFIRACDPTDLQL